MTRFTAAASGSTAGFALRKAIFVTGAASGIGRAIARHFAVRGWSVGLADIDEGGLGETVRILLGFDVSSYRLDVRSAHGWKQALEAFSGKNGGKINVLVNNAGVGVGGSLVDLSDEDIARMIDVNFWGALIGARTAHPYLRAAGQRSCLLNIASASAIYGTAGLAVYSSTKFALRGMTEALDLEWERDGVRCRSLMPAFVDTPMLAQPAEAGSRVQKRDRVIAAGLEFTPLEHVAEAAWRAVHGSRVHLTVGRSAKQMRLAARWAPGLLRRYLRHLLHTSIQPDCQGHRQDQKNLAQIDPRRLDRVGL